MKTIKTPLRVVFALLCLSSVAILNQNEPVKTVSLHSGASYQAVLIMEK